MALYNMIIRDLFSWQSPVKDKDLSDPPGSPVDGDRYIVGVSPTGVWSGHAKDITTYNGVSWDFAIPSKGWITYVLDEDTEYLYDGSAWIIKPLDIDESTIDHNLLHNYEVERHRKITFNAGTGTLVVEI